MAGFDNEVMYANNVDFTGSATPSAQVTTNGQLLIGSTAAPNIRVGTLSGGNNITVTAGAGTLSAAVTGTTNHAVQVGNASGSLTSIATGSSGQVLRSGGAGADPAWSTATYPATAGTNLTLLQSNGTNFVNTSATYPASTTANQILYSSATNVVGQITAAANSILLTNASNVPSLGTSLANSFTFTNATAGTNRFLKIEHTDNTNANSNAIVFIETGGSSSGDAFLRVGALSTRYYMVGCDTSDTQAYKISTATTGNQTVSSGTELYKMTSGGNRTMPLNSSVFAYRSADADDVTGDGTAYLVVFDAERYDQNGNFDTGTGTFTAPVAGKYLISANVSLGGLDASHTSGNILITAGGVSYRKFYNPGAVRDSSDQMTMSLCIVAALTAAQTATVTVTVSGGTKVVDILDENAGDFTNVSITLLT